MPPRHPGCQADMVLESLSIFCDHELFKASPLWLTSVSSVFHAHYLFSHVFIHSPLTEHLHVTDTVVGSEDPIENSTEKVPTTQDYIYVLRVGWTSMTSQLYILYLMKILEHVLWLIYSLFKFVSFSVTV